MEYALYASKLEQLEQYNRKYSRIYFGNEFCERLIPNLNQLREALRFAVTKKLKFTLTTPYVTDESLIKLNGLFEVLAETGTNPEVVFNDFGVLHILSNRYRELKPVMGRLLVKIPRDPRLMVLLENLPQKTLEHYRATNLTVESVCEFLNKKGVTRVEVDNVLQGVDFNLHGDLRVSVHTPYVYVTTTRLCLVNSCDKPRSELNVRIASCDKECQRYTFTLTNSALSVALIRKGNTLFYRNDTQIHVSGKIDRMVISPDLAM